MTNNDYIAQYIKEKHPSLLGFDFYIWKMCHVIGDTVRQIVDIFKTIPSDELKKIMEDAEDESDPETDTDEEDGEDERNIETDKEE